MPNRSNAPFCAGALLVLIAAIYNYLRPIIGSLRNFFLMSDSTSFDRALQVLLPPLIAHVAGGLVPFILLIVLCIRLLRKKNDSTNSGIIIVLAVFSGFSILGSLASYVLSAVSGAKLNISIFTSLALTVFYILLAVLSSASTKPQPGSFARLWFLPGAVYVLYNLVYIAETISYHLGLYPESVSMEIRGNIVLSVVLSNLIPAILGIVGWFLVGRWMTASAQRLIPKQPDVPFAAEPSTNCKDGYKSEF